MRFAGGLTLFLLVAVLAIFAAGCSGDDDSASSETGVEVATTQDEQAGETEPDQARNTEAEESVEAGEGSRESNRQREGGRERQGDGNGGSEASDFTPREHQDSGGGSQQFRVRGGDNSIQEFGEEVSSDEFVDVSYALHAYLDARAARNWAAACEYLSSRVTESLEQLAAQADQPTDCTSLMHALSAPLPPQVLRQAAVADVGSVRVEGDTGFVMFRGFGGDSFFMPMALEDGSWRVAALAASPLM